jgi:cell shape-determining protein MreD
MIIITLIGFAIVYSVQDCIILATISGIIFDMLYNTMIGPSIISFVLVVYVINKLLIFLEERNIVTYIVSFFAGSIVYASSYYIITAFLQINMDLYDYFFLSIGNIEYWTIGLPFMLLMMLFVQWLQKFKLLTPNQQKISNR